MIKTNLIYGLRDSRNDTYFYIGKTTIGIQRPMQHLKKSHNKNVNDMVSIIECSGSSVKIDVIKNNIDLNDLSNREKYWIEYYFQIYDLLNVQDTPNKNNEFSGIQDINIDEAKNLLELIIKSKDIVSNKRKYLKIKQEDLANESGLNRSTITQVEKGENISVKSLIKILEVLSINEKRNQRVRLL